MIEELAIKNFAIIEDLRIRLAPGLTIFSGETGAGKSIIISAVNLLLGGRASSRLIRTGAESAELEALFQVAPDSPAARAMVEHGYDPADGLLVRRIIHRDESNRIYINGSLATVAVLAELTGSLASISGQHAHQTLLKEDAHLLVLDRYGGLMALRQAVAEAYRAIQPLLAEGRHLEALKVRQSERIELLRFQRAEIQAAGLVPDEDEVLERERQVLRHAETLMRALDRGIAVLYSGDGAVLEQVAAVGKEMARAAAIDPALSAFAHRLDEMGILIQELSVEMQTHLGTLQVDEGRLAQVEERLEVLRRLKKKYGGTLPKVIDHLEDVERELDGIENIDARIEANRRALEDAAAGLAECCRRLSVGRQAAARDLARAVEAALATLRMEGTRFEVAMSRPAAGAGTEPYLVVDGTVAGEAGIDQVTFMLAPNVGEALKPLAAIASGGELSRVVLALKAILAANDAVETVVFDEVDAGIGGAVAEVVGRRLHDLAHHHQLICITHLPQIARFGDHHFRIEKTVVQGRTRTAIHPLDDKGRLEELARMLGGEKITGRTLAHARELLEQR
ncbi:MAG TPA: DNA repair protein RecN [Desulfobacteraceae bacterium]|nr:MAG: DNA repair protein RecN [Deltaproteobacteria bacterium]HDI60658.1 DNA repair protein RecN [Desulfobacteraceae bacterium]